MLEKNYFNLLTVNKKLIASLLRKKKKKTTSHSLNKVKPCWLGLVPGWVTKYEYPVLY